MLVFLATTDDNQYKQGVAMSAETHPGVAILASGGGSTAEAFIHATQSDLISAHVSLVICSKPREEAGIWDRVDRLNSDYGLDIPVVHISHKTHPWQPDEVPERGQTNAESEAIYRAVVASGARIAALMGYMRIVRGTLVEALGWQEDYTSPYQAALINTHPGPLPETADTYGIHASQRVLDLDLAFSAHTMHMVAAGVDTGPIINEALVPVLEGDTADDLFERVQIIEKAQLPAVIDGFLREQELFNRSA